mmetsp:Transcript_16756/g.36963  ORF Transcript_16756/g.36963 Transcript_16756/m.36963 type:complete len:962 (-) Transcript_16756:2982-5867(-)
MRHLPRQHKALMILSLICLAGASGIITQDTHSPVMLHQRSSMIRRSLISASSPWHKISVGHKSDMRFSPALYRTSKAIASVAVRKLYVQEYATAKKALEGRAKAVANAAATLALPRVAAASARRSYRHAERALASRARKTCRRVCGPVLARDCRTHARRLFKGIQGKAVLTWSNAAQRRARAATVSKATAAALKAARYNPQRIAISAGEAVFRKEYSAFARRFKKVSKQAVQQIAAQKKGYYAKAQAVLVKKVVGEVKLAMRSALGEALRRMTGFASSSAQKEAQKSVAQLLRARSAEAVRSVLPEAVRLAHLTRASNALAPHVSGYCSASTKPVRSGVVYELLGSAVSSSSKWMPSIGSSAATIVGGALRKPAEKSVGFSADGQYVVLPVDINPSRKRFVTLEAWVKCDKVASQHGWIMSNAGKVGRRWKDGRTVALHDKRFGSTKGVGHVGITTGKSWKSDLGKIGLGKWHHVVGVFRQGSSSFAFLNGFRSRVAGGRTKSSRGRHKMYIGSPPGRKGYWSQCSVASVRVYKRALLEHEVIQNYVAGPACSARACAGCDKGRTPPRSLLPAAPSRCSLVANGGFEAQARLVHRTYWGPISGFQKQGRVMLRKNPLSRVKQFGSVHAVLRGRSSLGTTLYGTKKAAVHVVYFVARSTGMPAKLVVTSGSQVVFAGRIGKVWKWQSAVFVADAASVSLAFSTPVSIGSQEVELDNVCFSLWNASQVVPAAKGVPRSCKQSVAEAYRGSNGRLYRGFQAVSRSGLTCQPWHKALSTKQRKCRKSGVVRLGRHGVGKHNFCRNPDRSPTIWCFTAGKHGKSWDFCDPKGFVDDRRSVVQDCRDERLYGPSGAEYRGCQSKTRRGLTCQSWVAQSPHHHHRTERNFPLSGLGSHNFCRNPDGSRTLWCYTTNARVRWDYCRPRRTTRATAGWAGSRRRCTSRRRRTRSQRRGGNRRRRRLPPRL